MKKTLALLLAMLMLLSVVFISCDKKDDETEPDDPFANVEDPDDTSDGTGEGDGTEDSTDFVEASGTYYLRHTVYVSKDGKKKGTESKNAGVAEFASAVTVTAQNSKWFKVTFKNAKADNAETEGYLQKDVLTNDFTVVNVKMLDTPVKAEIANLGKNKDDTPITANIRTTPWNCSGIADYKNVNVLLDILNEKLKVSDGQAVEKIGATEDGTWIYIKFTAKVDDADKTYWGFCHKDYIKTEGESSGQPADPNTPPAILPA